MPHLDHSNPGPREPSAEDRFVATLDPSALRLKLSQASNRDTNSLARSQAPRKSSQDSDDFFEHFHECISVAKGLYQKVPDDRRLPALCAVLEKLLPKDGPLSRPQRDLLSYFSGRALPADLYSRLSPKLRAVAVATIKEHGAGDWLNRLLSLGDLEAPEVVDAVEADMVKKLGKRTPMPNAYASAEIPALDPVLQRAVLARPSVVKAAKDYLLALIDHPKMSYTELVLCARELSQRDFLEQPIFLKAACASLSKALDQASKPTAGDAQGDFLARCAELAKHLAPYVDDRDELKRLQISQAVRGLAKKAQAPIRLALGVDQDSQFHMEAAFSSIFTLLDILPCKRFRGSPELKWRLQTPFLCALASPAASHSPVHLTSVAERLGWNKLLDDSTFFKAVGKSFVAALSSVAMACGENLKEKQLYSPQIADRLKKECSWLGSLTADSASAEQALKKCAIDWRDLGHFQRIVLDTLSARLDSLRLRRTYFVRLAKLLDSGETLSADTADLLKRISGNMRLEDQKADTEPLILLADTISKLADLGGLAQAHVAQTLDRADFAQTLVELPEVHKLLEPIPEKLFLKAAHRIRRDFSRKAMPENGLDTGNSLRLEGTREEFSRLQARFQLFEKWQDPYGMLTTLDQVVALESCDVSRSPELRGAIYNMKRAYYFLVNDQVKAAEVTLDERLATVDAGQKTAAYLLAPRYALMQAQLEKVAALSDGIGKRRLQNSIIGNANKALQLLSEIHKADLADPAATLDLNPASPIFLDYSLAFRCTLAQVHCALGDPLAVEKITGEIRQIAASLARACEAKQSSMHAVLVESRAVNLLEEKVFNLQHVNQYIPFALALYPALAQLQLAYSHSKTHLSGTVAPVHKAFPEEIEKYTRILYSWAALLHQQGDHNQAPKVLAKAKKRAQEHRLADLLKQINELQKSMEDG